jgi:hypothetical protein
MSPARPRRAETRPFPSKATGSLDPGAYELVREESERPRMQCGKGCVSAHLGRAGGNSDFFSSLIWDIVIHQA